MARALAAAASGGPRRVPVPGRGRGRPGRSGVGAQRDVRAREGGGAFRARAERLRGLDDGVVGLRWRPAVRSPRDAPAPQAARPVRHRTLSACVCPPGALRGVRRPRGNAGLLWGPGPSLDLRSNVAPHLLSPQGTVRLQLETLIAQEEGLGDPAAYNAIVRAVAAGATTRPRIADSTGLNADASLVRRLDRVVEVSLREGR